VEKVGTTELPKLTFIEQIAIDGTKYNPVLISAWLKSKGLIHGVDYIWWNDNFSQANHVIVFKFKDAKWCSLLAIKYS
jgi:hypothetical protein